MFIKAPVCRRAFISEETRALGAGVCSSLMPAWSEETAKVYTRELTWEARHCECWQHSALAHLLMSL